MSVTELENYSKFETVETTILTAVKLQKHFLLDLTDKQPIVEILLLAVKL